MTREEVINGLYDIKNWKCNGDAEMYKTIVEAIQALKQSDPCEDAVSRKDVQSITEKSDWFESSDSFNDFMWALYELPPVTPKQKVSISEIRNQVAGKPVDLFTELTDEEKKRNKWYVQGYTDAMKRKTGKWISQDLNKHSGMISTAVYYYPKCSVCGNNANYTNFCPNCGAKMNGGEQE